MKLTKNQWKSPKVVGTFIGAVVVCIVALTLIYAYVNRNTVRISNYIRIQYTGANHYAQAEGVIDTDKLYKMLAGKEKNMEKLTAYRKLVDSIYVQIDQNNISNGDEVQVKVLYDEDAAQNAQIELADTTYKAKASGISEGTKVSLFEKVEVVFAGMSPEAYIKVTNRWDDAYLGSLEFVPDKNSKIAIGDVIHITCSANMEELGKHGYVVTQDSLDYTVSQLNSYANITDIDAAVVQNIANEAMQTIQTQVEDTTFRMLYKATQDSSYLRANNDESVSNIRLLNKYYLKRKNAGEGTVDNYIYLVYAADVTSSAATMTVYFTFEYSQGYVSPDKVFNIMHDKPEQRYQCSGDYETLFNTVIKEKESLYEILPLS